MSKLWVFGDSFSAPFYTDKNKKFESGEDWETISSPFNRYLNHIRVIPKTYSELLSEDLGVELINQSMSGGSNTTIFHTFINSLPLIEDDDVIIFGWTQNFRFRIANDDNELITILIGVLDLYPPKSENLSKQTLQEISLNRENFTVHYTELIDYIKLINFVLKNNSVIHWTWVPPTKEDDFYENAYYNQLVPFKEYKSITDETNGVIVDHHYGSKSHFELFLDLKSQINKKSSKKIKKLI